ncbi:hypothetical protein N8T08_011164 [Aspergillus melleus]|uniref:Uncharacterized protein n=1 Tax=Aspergillus melleus TaxID=138277 RepID=A0ACC3AQ60_9EURO|nr:hypothetical protein N8T08_011164 [Aspergillus melleus]
MLTLTSILSLFLFTSILDPTAAICRCLPGDPCWPAPATWSQFNASISGQLIATNPLGAPCHDPNYDAARCAQLRDNWTHPRLHYESSSSVMAPYFANNSCDPFHPPGKPCTLDNYVVYAVNASTPEHVTRALQFVRDHNIRLVVRNTGHDYLGKSTGAGALGLWMHHLKEITVADYRDARYTGKAITVGAGVHAIDVYRAADAQGLQIVGGECPTVGLAGGYTQGGGHSMLSSKYGLAADQVLSWQVITGEGELVTATRETYPDLYWALSGGGGGTYGVVWSMTVKAYPDTPVSGLNMTFSREDVEEEEFYRAVSRFHAILPDIVDAGAMCIWSLTNTSFSISPLTGPNIPASELVDLLGPFTDHLDEEEITYTISADDFPDYLSQFQNMMPDVPVSESQLGGWLIPRGVVQENNENFTAAARQIVEDGASLVSVGLNVSKAVAGNVDNAVLPAWRDTVAHTVISTPWEWNADDKMREWQRKMTEVYVSLLSRLAPNSGAYMNEADFRQPNYQRAFYGENYAKLREIKKKYDPFDVFYAPTAVGSDEWTESNRGRLCRVTRVNLGTWLSRQAKAAFT